MAKLMTKAKYYLLVLTLVLSFASTQAEEEKTKKETLLVVGIGYNQLSPAVRQSMGELNVVEVEFSPQWQRYIDQSDADKVIVRHPSGYTALYYKDGTFLRDLGTSPASYAYPYDTSLGSNIRRPAADAISPTPDWHQVGYNTGGRSDPYRNYSPPSSKANTAKLSPGWGYNREKQVPSRKDTIFQFLSFFPIDTVTPFNYPGTFDSAGVPTAYALGSLPHIGGMALELREAKKQRAVYDANATALPEFAEYPTQMYNAQDPNNPLTQDPNLIHMSPMPQAFGMKYPNYEQQAEYYRNYGKPMP